MKEQTIEALQERLRLAQAGENNENQDELRQAIIKLSAGKTYGEIKKKHADAYNKIMEDAGVFWA